MSSAKKDKQKAALRWHVSSFLFIFFHRAKPVSEMERSGIERPYTKKNRRPKPWKRKTQPKTHPTPPKTKTRRSVKSSAVRRAKPAP